MNDNTINDNIVNDNIVNDNTVNGNNNIDKNICPYHGIDLSKTITNCKKCSKAFRYRIKHFAVIISEDHTIIQSPVIRDNFNSVLKKY